MHGPAFSIVVPTRDRPQLLARCLASLQALEHPDYEIVVVDNSPGDDDVRRAAERAGAVYVLEPRPGVSPARNAGTRSARGAIIAYIDDDAVAEPDWLARHAAALRDPGLAATTGRIRIASNTAAAHLYAEQGTEDLGPTGFRIDNRTPRWFEIANFGGVGSGSNMAFRREIFDRGWRFPESLGKGSPVPGAEDHYAFFSLIRTGHAVAYVPDAVVRHRAPASMSELRERRRRMLRVGAAYCLMLLVEEPRFRGATLRYIGVALGGRRREWRVQPGVRFATRPQLAAAACIAPLLYARSRVLQSRASGT